MKKRFKIILIIILVLIGIIIVDSLQALVFNNNVVLGIETKCMKKTGILVDTYHCGNMKNKTVIKNFTCSSELVCGKNDEIKEEKDVTLSVKDGTLTSKGATFILKNNSENEYWYGNEYFIEKYENNKWMEVKTITGDPLVWNSVIYTLKLNEEKELNIDWMIGYNELSDGKYRLVKKIFLKDNLEDKSKTLYANFVINLKSIKLEVVKSNRENNQFNIYLKKDNRIIYLSSKLDDVYYITDNNKISLKNYLIKSYQTFYDSLKHITDILEYQDTLKDGGTTIYKSLEYDITLIKCNTIVGNYDIYIGDYSMSFDNELMCKNNV